MVVFVLVVDNLFVFYDIFFIDGFDVGIIDWEIDYDGIFCSRLVQFNCNVIYLELFCFVDQFDVEVGVIGIYDFKIEGQFVIGYFFEFQVEFFWQWFFIGIRGYQVGF